MVVFGLVCAPLGAALHPPARPGPGARVSELCQLMARSKYLGGPGKALIGPWRRRAAAAPIL